MTNLRLSAPMRLDQLLDRFIPAEMAAERETRQRARMFLISHLFGPVIGSVIPAYLFFLDPHAGYKLGVLTVSIWAFWLYPLVLKLSRRYTLLALVSVQNLLFAVLWGCYFYGGVSSPFLPWLLTVPLLAFFYLGSGPLARRFVIAIITVNMIGFFAIYFFGPTFPSDASLKSLQGIGIVSTLSASGYVSMMALYYARILASGVELEGEMKGHLATAAELRRATAEAERAGAAKAEFLAKMSHELRTPLNAVIGYSQILLEDAAAEGDKESVADLEKIHGAGHHLLRLVNEVLDLSKIEAGKMDLVIEEVDLAALLGDVVDHTRGVAAKTDNALSLEVDPEIGRITCDSRKVQAVLDQLLDNAAKFTRGGSIVVSAERESGGETVLLRVRDTGAGISPASLPGLFEKFHVAEDSSPSKYGGAGLGLALSLRLCRLMGGDIWVESELGAGACFTVRLPVSPPEAAAKIDGACDSGSELDSTDASVVETALTHAA